ncbi:phosphotransferase [Geodermatophilus sabuli]|uniref:Phosphotransferase enzyme family protein n=1 Tax=Geodermatophilus sabuli TaxID=1564158 RepID=A0A285EEJ7_9ACTN|nr:phosphotransferase [Geodermatophilus sabuli]MBB3086320.1 hypothetical protein [Geodermatophilus sabuli]SNX97465.1 Phosphotransferase enzyme family protein [Geodermatophilus sabuli]
MTALPGGLAVDELGGHLRRWTGRAGLVVDAVTCTPIPHRISAPTTRALTRVTVATADGALPLRLVAKELQAARHGLPPQMPDDTRAHLDALIPWRLEADVLTGDVATLMPPGLRTPDVVAVHEQDGDRLTLWLEDADPVDAPWTSADTARAASRLGRLTARRVGRSMPPTPGGDLLTSYRDEQLGAWAVPWLLDDATWAHPLFRLPEVAALREEVCTLAGRVADVHARLADLPLLPAHGDPTPMNLLRPRRDPQGFVLVDWGMTGSAPAGFDLLPLVFGRAESGVGPPEEVPALLDIAVPAYRAGLAAEGVDVPLADLAAGVRTAAQLRYPCTTMPLTLTMEPVTDAAVTRARERAAFVRMVLDLPAVLPV